MTMKIGERAIIAEIQEKEKTREAFDKAKTENKSASLLTQKHPNLFSMEVAKILPGDELTLTLRYSEILVPNSGSYELVIPSATLSSSPMALSTPEPQSSTSSKTRTPERISSRSESAPVSIATSSRA